MVLSICTVFASEILLRLSNLSILVIGTQALLLVSFLIFARFKRRLNYGEATVFILVFGVILIYFVRDVLERGGISLDAVGNTLRLLAFAKLALAAREISISEEQLAWLAKLILVMSLVTVVMIRQAGVTSSIRVEPVLLSFVYGLIIFKEKRARGYGTVYLVLSLGVLMLAQKASLILAAIASVLIVYPFFILVLMVTLFIVIPSLSIVLDFFEYYDVLGRIVVRFRLLTESVSGFDRNVLARITSNRSEEYFFVLEQWKSTGFPIWGSGLSATIFIENVDVERSTFHNLFVNIVRMCGVASILFLSLIWIVLQRSFQISRFALAITVGLLMHNLLTYSLFHSPIIYFIILFLPSSSAVRVSDRRDIGPD